MLCLDTSEVLNVKHKAMCKSNAFFVKPTQVEIRKQKAELKEFRWGSRLMYPFCTFELLYFCTFGWTTRLASTPLVVAGTPFVLGHKHNYTSDEPEIRAVSMYFSIFMKFSCMIDLHK